MSQLDSFRLDGRVAFVSGGGGAIGSALAVALGSAGARVAVSDIDQARAEAAAERVRAAGAECIALAADITREAEAERVVAAIVERFGRLDIIVNAVGGGAGKVLFDAEEYPRDAWDWIMELNLRSTLVRDPGGGPGDDRRPATAAGSSTSARSAPSSASTPATRPTWPPRAPSAR